MNTFGYSSHTPVTEVKWVWFDILHLTDVFDVVFVSQCSPSAHGGTLTVPVRVHENFTAMPIISNGHMDTHPLLGVQ